MNAAYACGTPSEAATWNALPSYRNNTPNLASQIRTAFASMASNTGSSSPGELLMTLSTSEVAVCCCSDSRSSLSRRVFSIAMTAWAAKVRSSWIWVGEKGPGCLRLTTMAPMGRPSRSMGAASMLRKPPACPMSFG